MVGLGLGVGLGRLWFMVRGLGLVGLGLGGLELGVRGGIRVRVVSLIIFLF